MEDIICDMKFDGKHSYEDNIIPVEEAYRRWGGRIAILGGIDVDFLIRSECGVVRNAAERCWSWPRRRAAMRWAPEIVSQSISPMKSTLP